MPAAELPYPLFDADNHLYETEESLTKYLPKAVPGRDPVRAGQGPHQDRDPRPDQRLHPQPHLRGGRPARGDGGVLQARQPARARAAGRSSASRCARSRRSASRVPAWS